MGRCFTVARLPVRELEVILLDRVFFFKKKKKPFPKQKWLIRKTQLISDCKKNTPKLYTTVRNRRSVKIDLQPANIRCNIFFFVFFFFIFNILPPNKHGLLRLRIVHMRLLADTGWCPAPAVRPLKLLHCVSLP